VQLSELQALNLAKTRSTAVLHRCRADQKWDMPFVRRITLLGRTARVIASCSGDFHAFLAML
jgi:hypothetical protein